MEDCPHRGTLRPATRVVGEATCTSLEMILVTGSHIGGFR